MSNFRRIFVYDTTNTNGWNIDANNNGPVVVYNSSGTELFTLANAGFTKVTDGTEIVLVNADGSINAVVTATDLDIRDLTAVSDSVEVIGVTPDGTNQMPSMDTVARAAFQKVTDGTEILLINADGSINSVVTATDLDIRDLDATQDNVEVIGVKPDGTNTQPSMDTVGRAGYQYVTDGTNTQPTLDANTRRGYVELTDGTTEPDMVTYEGHKSLQIAMGRKSTFHVHLDADNISADQGFMLIDLSDTTNWPHTNTGHIVLDQVIVNTSTSSTPAFVGEVEFGFLANVDATDGDLNVIGKFHMDRGSFVNGGAYDFSIYGMDLEEAEWFGPTNANDVTWQTDVNLQGPDGATSYPSGDDDFVMHIVNVSAGSIDIAVTVIYTTES